ncbi:hypothetical protein HRI_000062000 [Hibiscus trionum]|uniref:Transposase-associated domain-containing protein n=1 Tax=Hibiscus trionum TaxID=183268 RepID=A0A9W7GRV6_HIBTR|nr:hypothetical protein HRI_000062000 [Hibiscus trionum]
MDKTWINLRSRASEEYIRGVTSFLNFAFERTEDGKIWCPCVNCVNTYRVSRRDAFDHLICDGFLKGYVRWIFHGEQCDGSTPPIPTNVEEREFEHDVHNLLHDMMADRVVNNAEHNYHSGDKLQTVEQMVRNCKDSRVNKEQLKTLVEYWLSSKSMEQSATNRLNRSKLDEPHCTGTRSFPRIVEDMTAESSGIPPSRADVYVRTRTRKDGSIVNSAAAVVVERIQEKINEGTSSRNLSQATSWSNDVFAQVKGPERKGRVRCVGAVQTRPSQESGPSQPVQNTEEVEGLKAKLAAFEKLLETCLLPIYRQQRPDLHVPDMNALLQIVDTQAAPDAGSATAAVNSRSMPSENQHNIDDPSTQ